MIKNYLTIAVRNLLRYKGYSIISIVGLAVGMACCLLFSLYYIEETGYDQYHADNDRVFRVVQVSQPWVDETSSACTAAPLAPLLRDKLPQVERAAQVMRARETVVKQEQICRYESRMFWSGSELFSVLSIPMVEGNPQTALIDPSTAVLTEGTARKYFGTTNAIGRTLRIGANDYKVTGVIADAPYNTHFKYDLFLSLKTLEGRYPFDNWGLGNFYTYVKLAPGADPATLTTAMNREALPFITAAGGQDRTAFVFQPVASIHLQSHLRAELDRPGSPLMLTIVLVVGALVLGIAGLNYANLATARASLRAKEVALRHAVGAARGQLICQLLGESLLLAAIAFVMAIVIVESLLPAARAITGAHLDSGLLLQPPVMLLLAVIVLASGLLAGLYPALALTAVQPAVALKGSSIGDSRRTRGQLPLVTGQLAIAVIFVAFAFTVFNQIEHMQQTPLGFSAGDRMVLHAGLRRGQDYRTFKQELLRLPEIAGVTASSAVPGVAFPGYWDTWLTNADEKSARPMTYLYCDEDFIHEYGITLVAGRPFSGATKGDSATSCIVNRAAMRTLGFDTPEAALGAKLYCGISDIERTVVGVMDDFHFEGLQKTIEPLVMDYNPQSMQYLSLRLQTADRRTTIAAISSAWRKTFPDNPLDWFLLDGQFNRQYQSEERFGRLLLAATGLGLVIACMGLLGLTAFAAARRTKEIGIRKVLGASTSSVLLMLVSDLGRAVVLAFLVAWPIGYWIMNRWLQNFAYRTSVGIGTFLISSLIVLLIAVLTVSYQAYSTAHANPVDSLKYE